MNTNQLANHAAGHVKIVDASGKYYRARIRCNNLSRWSLRKFRKAVQADIYGEDLIARYIVLTSKKEEESHELS